MKKAVDPLDSMIDVSVGTLARRDGFCDQNSQFNRESIPVCVGLSLARESRHQMQQRSVNPN
ncbi:hypothetical protein T265_07391 [Opisthorchis viverrini]|uniref:Uncharacterized protein n=1 Tax=Opisthorchis viverrini TaxID=6198 RepID=A0A074ZP45_OPIVI|nr:hypothetical protein T265_07391 [Opisthorchis viverrini]KER25105.1 hypothetical protein T265_07391 [Opisthorchis viverrini]